MEHHQGINIHIMWASEGEEERGENIREMMILNSMLKVKAKESILK